ncbi:carbamoyl phosphate phosphatase, hydrogenase 3 maturation protein [Candidatus Terasakiella magnetica]|uniref:Carbamoyl phosphate phosphatase, hydrogenase 3 maturation protein n=1 Tax=Candidatus Terasakiella magnetica TaxID=1867952 RepID=A0A1C3RJ64_9PROT|nr:hydrogenase expression/formation protein HypE [Candidatus Terasakiella magnetica]SCA57298.1 carbamoyl phosphate phosphatase, hydrogenase 3 maturation protein [Candidatus Terasakiella magnetica]
MSPRTAYSRALDLENGVVEMCHGGGGRAMAQLIDQLFADAFANDILAQGNDQAVFDLPAGRVVMSTDNFVISPLFFPGGNIGSLAVHGTVNDVALSGGRPLYLTAGFILEEGYPLKELKLIVESMAKAAEQAGVKIVTGDTKVVERGHGDGVYINTTGIGVVDEAITVSGERAKPGDKILINGFVGDHGVAIMSLREGLGFDSSIQSDCASLNGLISDMISAVPDIHVMRDPTRGGLAATLNELAHQSGVGMELLENKIPIRDEVRGACEILGLDPLYVANEGKLLAICAEEEAENLLAAMKAHPLGKDAAIIGRVLEDDHHFVQLKTSFGGSRVVDWIAGEQLPRIC